MLFYSLLKISFNLFLVLKEETPTDPCQPSPCGPNSICVKSHETPACTCQPNFIGAPPNCRPECTISAECPATLACVSQRCKDPCEQACGPRAICSVVDHRATCACEPGLDGDPFQGCSSPKGKHLDYLTLSYLYDIFCYSLYRFETNRN